jgi:predicted ATPase/DNA-binding CsgD family transcriptional regulator
MAGYDDFVITEHLTDREIEILRLIGEGQSNREIAQELSLSLETVKWYNKRAFSKLGVSSRVQAVVKAKQYRLLDEDRDSPEKGIRLARHNLPSEVSSFVGRKQEMADVRELLQKARLVTLTGPGGTGKTRLSLRVARILAGSYPDGVFFVSLATITNPALVSNQIAQELGVIDRTNRSLLSSLKRHLRDKQLLLVLDNFEHVVKAAPLVTELLAAAPSLRVLTTSREALRLSGEHEYLVPPLAVPALALTGSISELATYESVTLFIQRAVAASPNFNLTEENGPAVAGICLHLDGLPLAIELAAARIKLFSPQQLLERLENRLGLLTGGSRDLPARHRALRDTIEWSYDLLDQGEQQLFARLAVFRNGCSIEAVEAICSPGLNADVLDGLQSLLNKSLLYQAEIPSGEIRFLMHETMREYALERLADSGEEEQIRTRHLMFFLKLAEKAELHLDGSEQAAWLNRLDIEHDNLRTAVNWSQSAEGTGELTLRLASALADFWDWRGYLSEGREHLSAALSRRATTKRTRVRAKALFEAGSLAYEQGDYPAARDYLEESLFIFRELEPADQLDIAHCLRMLGDTEIAVGGYTRGTTLLSDSLEIFRELNDLNGTARALWQLGWCAVRPGDFERANRCFSEALPLYQDIGDKNGLAYVMAGMGEVALRQGDYDRAKELLDESLALRYEYGADWGIAATIGSLGWLALRQGDLEAAEKLIRESLTIRLEIGDRSGTAWCLEKMAEIALTTGNLGDSIEENKKMRRAARLFGAAAALREPLESTIDLADQPEYERQIGEVRSHLDEATFAVAWDAGQTMTFEQAVAYALAE